MLLVVPFDKVARQVKVTDPPTMVEATEGLTANEETVSGVLLMAVCPHEYSESTRQSGNKSKFFIRALLESALAVAFHDYRIRSVGGKETNHQRRWCGRADFDRAVDGPGKLGCDRAR